MQFKRSIQTILLSILIPLIILYLTALALIGTYTYLIIVLLILIISVFIVAFVLPPDFDYYIRVCDDTIIFEFSRTDHRSISNKFVISNSTERYMVLDDGDSRIRIGYDKKVKEFLEDAMYY